MDCAFCTEFTAASAGQTTNRIICQVSGWVLLPTVGCFTPGRRSSPASQAAPIGS